MTDQDRKAARREIADALLKALERRHEVADVVVESENKAAALDAIVKLLDTSHLAAEAVMSMSFDRLTIESRKQILAELEDLNKQLSFTVGERPASRVTPWSCCPFGRPGARPCTAPRISVPPVTEPGAGRQTRRGNRCGAGTCRRRGGCWFVAVDSGDKVGMVFGELVHGEVEVRIWIHPDHRKKGYGTAALRRSRSEMAWCFPAVPMVVRSPGDEPG